MKFKGLLVLPLIFTFSSFLNATSLSKNVRPRVIALELSFVEGLVGLGISPVGISDDGDFQRILKPLRGRMTSYTSVGTRKQPNLELIAGLKPTLILADKKRHSHAKRQLEKMAPTLFLPSLGENYFSQIEALKKIAKVLGLEKKYHERMKRHFAKLENFRDTFNFWKGQKILFGVSWEKGVHIHSMRGFIPSLFKHVGLDYGLGDGIFEKASEKIGLEQLLKINPDVLIIARSKPFVLLDQWMKSSLWKLLKVSQNKQIYFVDQNLWTRARGVLASELILEDLKKLKKGTL
jgi:iron complex transport system substrate-binding protein